MDDTRSRFGRRWPSLGVRRLPVIDVMRGSAMLLVILSHAAALVDIRSAPAQAYLALIRFTNLASIAFVFLSGTMVSYFFETCDRRRVALRFARRALFLAFVIHPAIWLACWFWSPGQPLVMLRAWYITDTIAVCLLIGPPIMRLLTLRSRVVVAALLPIVAALARVFLVPSSELGVTLKYLAVGSVPLSISYPLLPWLAVFLAGSVLGATIARAGENRDGLRELSGGLIRTGAALVGAGVATVAIYKAARAFLPDWWNPELLQSIRPDRTTILFPAYLGAVLLLLAFIIHHHNRPGGSSWFAWAISVIGRTSLFAFVTQFAVVWSLPALLGLRKSLTIVTLWPTFLFSAALVWCLCYAYGRLTNRVRVHEHPWPLQVGASGRQVPDRAADEALSV